MVDSTRTATLVREVEERVCARWEESLDARIDGKFMALASNLTENLTKRMEELLQGRSANHVSTSPHASQSRSSSYSCDTRLARLNFSKFNGDGVNQWLIQCETFFLVDQTPDDCKVKLAVMHLEGKAMQWHNVYVRTVGLMNLPNWEEYSGLLLDRFGDVCEDPMADLMKLRQKGSVGEYHEEFDALVSRIELTPEHQLSCFLGGLKQEVQMMVRMFQPTTVRKAFSLAKMYESSSLNGQHKFGMLKPQRTVSPAILNSTLVMNNAVKQPASLNRPVHNKTLSSAFMNERRARGLCFFCDEKYTPEHGLQHKKLQIHVLEVADVDEFQEAGESVEEEAGSEHEPIISVNALTGVSSFRTMRVTGYHGKRTLHILIDSGSTHNFLDEAMACKLGCRIEKMDAVNVTVTDGNKVKVGSKVNDFSWTLQNTVFTSDMMLLPLGCCDLVLGIEWLVTLGDITWNFNKLSMEFFVQGKRHVLRRGVSAGLQTAKGQQLTKAITQGVHLAMLSIDTCVTSTDNTCY